MTRLGKAGTQGTSREKAMVIVLPKDIEEIAARRALEEGVASLVDYIARLVEWDAGGGVDTDEELEAKLLEALDDEDDEPFDIESLRAEVHERIRARRAGS